MVGNKGTGRGQIHPKTLWGKEGSKWPDLQDFFIERINMNFNVKSFISQMLIQILSLLGSSVRGILPARILV